jgi:Flp pilus assembly protein TadD
LSNDHRDVVRVAGFGLRSVGAAQYRAGDYRNAIETLKKAQSVISDPSPAIPCFMSMAQFQLEQFDKARQNLEIARD